MDNIEADRGGKQQEATEEALREMAPSPRESPSPQLEHSMFIQLSAIFFNLFCSTAMSFVNKWALLLLPLPTALLVLQVGR